MATTEKKLSDKTLDRIKLAAARCERPGCGHQAVAHKKLRGGSGSRRGFCFARTEKAGQGFCGVCECDGYVGSA